MGDVVVPVQNHLLLGVLIQKDVLFGRDILLHPLVDVQMVGCQVGDHGDVRAGVHGH